MSKSASVEAIFENALQNIFVSRGSDVSEAYDIAKHVLWELADVKASVSTYPSVEAVLEDYDLPTELKYFYL